MGRDVPATQFSRDDRRRYRDKLKRSLDVLARMLGEARFDAERPLAGLEIELNLVDDQGEPAMKNAEVLDAISAPDWDTELGQFNVEINVAPRELGGPGLVELEQTVRNSLNHAEAQARTVGGHMVLVGILPTLKESDLSESTLSANPRYKLLNEQIFAARGEDLRIAIDGVERLHTYADSITPEAACTSVQLHLQVSPRNFAAHWNAAQAIAGPQVAVAANSPYLFGKELWRETRLSLFEQATDTRPDELKAQGVRPRVWFGDRWITSVFDLFEENNRYFPALLPLCDDEDPAMVLEAGGVPTLSELTLHNGTIYRWNRPVYDVSGGLPHLRVENRVLPAGPSVADILANAAFYYGLMRVLPFAERPVWTQMSFSAAADNLRAAARHGIDARLYWPGMGEVTAAELILRRLLPLAHDGLNLWGCDPKCRDRLLGIIEQRCLTGVTGATWQVRKVREHGGGHEGLRRMTLEYMANMHTNEPVHQWG
ncbi:glutamate-cysteine ligase family protein [Herbidospora cretacea]|uniref:glutamate-cysteine ligase family protein n=1 Tax=Herbidospora cretacea TaxID=28444 RepID=UPI0004C33FE7|nr:glutamate-cysteine ligase family protein [Herbidospora cretacea]